jgi:AcrR family transcriptional regulator
LVETARAILAREASIDAVTLRGVARELGIAAPSIYRHFPSRQALVQAAIGAQFNRLAAATQVDGDHDTKLDTLRAGMIGYCQFAERDPGGYAVLFARPIPAQLFDESADEAFNGLVRRVASCIDEGTIPKGDPFAIARRAWTSLHGIVSLRTVMPNFPWNDLDEAVDDVLADLTRTDTSGRNLC